MRYRVKLANGTLTTFRFTAWTAALRWACYRNMGIQAGTIDGFEAVDIVNDDGTPVSKG